MKSDAKQAPSSVESGAEQVLVVDDDAFIRDYLVEMLVGLGYQVTAAASGAEALRIVHDRPLLDLLLTDVMMPGELNGRQLAAAARNLRQSIRVLFCSGYVEDILIRDGRLEPGNAFLKKPFRRAELAAKVRMALDGQI